MLEAGEKLKDRICQEFVLEKNQLFKINCVNSNIKVELAQFFAYMTRGQLNSKLKAKIKVLFLQKI